MRSVFVLAAAVVCLPAVSLAQNPAPPSTAQPPSPEAQAAFSIERLSTRVRFEDDGTGRRESTYRIKVLDEQAVRQFGEFPLVYESETENLAITEIAVEKPDGTVTPTGTDNVQDVSAVPGQSRVFVDVRQKIISVTALRPGDILRISAVWTTSKPIAPGQFWYDYSFDRKDVVRDEQLEIDIPAERTVALKVAAGSPTEEHGGSGAVTGNRRVYRWRTSHPEVVTKEPPLYPGDDLPPPDIRLSSFKDWNDFARWYTPLAFVAPDASVKAKAAALTAGLSDDAAKMAAIYRFVSTEIRYVSLSFGLGRFAAHGPADVLRNQYGDCKDKAVLLRALYEAAGLRALPVLVNVTRSIDDDFASPLEFNHMVALLPGPLQPDGTWMDSTIEVAPLGMLSLPTRNKRVLLLDGKGQASVVRTPADPPFASLQDIHLTGTVNSIGVLTARGSMAFRGDSGVLLRTAVRAMPRTALKDLVSQLATANGIRGDIDDVQTSDPADTKEPFELTFNLRSKDALDWAAERSKLRIPLKERLDQPDNRKELHRIWLGSPENVRMTASLELPAGYDAVAPAAISQSRAGVQFTSTYAVSGRQLTLQRELKTTAREVPESAFGEYSALAATIEADDQQAFAVHRGTDIALDIPPDAKTDELYAAGGSAWDAERYKDAAALYKRATDLDPKMGDAWIGLGLAYNKLRKFDDAEAAIRRQIALDPYNKRAYSDLAFVLKSAGKDADAAAAYAKHLELNPLDGDAFRELGELEDELLRSTEAAAALEKASTLLKPDPWVYADLGTAYLHLRRPDQARQAFARALEIDSTAALQAKVSWQLADAGIDLDRAEDLATKAEHEIAADSVDLASLTDDQLDAMETLAWTWDAIGWIRFQRGNLTEAEEYVRAAWLLGGFPSTAFHLARIEHKRGRLADGLSYALTAEALSSPPTPEMVDRVKRQLGPGADLKAMLEAARRTAPMDRVVRLSPKAPKAPVSSADFFVIVDNHHKALDVRFKSGAGSLRALDSALRAARYPPSVPEELPARLVLDVKVACDAAQSCVGMVAYPSKVDLKR
jgi:tetratricopeptide (TPR) repeat protein